MKSSWQNIQSPFRQIFIKQKYAESKCMELWTVLTACYVDNTLTTWTINWLHWHYIDYVDTTLTTWTIHGQYIDYIDTTLSTLTLHWVHWHYIDYINIVLATLTLHWAAYLRICGHCPSISARPAIPVHSPQPVVHLLYCFAYFTYSDCSAFCINHFFNRVCMDQCTI